jgi:hypothetical protein
LDWERALAEKPGGVKWFEGQPKSLTNPSNWAQGRAQQRPGRAWFPTLEFEFNSAFSGMAVWLPKKSRR